MLFAVFSAFLLAPFAHLFHRRFGRATGWILGGYAASIAAYCVARLTGVARTGEAVRFALEWIPSLGVDLSFHGDGLGLTFAAVIAGVGAAIFVYAGGYMGDDPRSGRLFGLLLAFMGAMLGVALAGNVLTLFVFWEATSLASYMLIGFDHRKEEARASALQALLVTGGGGLALLAGLLVLGDVAGTFSIEGMAEASREVRRSELYPLFATLILIGAFTKSAQVPFHFWLPGAMTAPTPVSAYLHSATMVKAGVYLLARLHPTLGGTVLWGGVVTAIGLATMLTGAWLALQNRDLKKILAYSTIGVLGTLTFLLGLGTAKAATAAMAYLLAHSMYKATLFMVAGSIDHETGTRDAGKLSGLRRAMPVTFAAGALAAVSMAGIPPMFGFVGKEVLYEATIRAQWPLLAALPVAMIVVAASAMMAAAGALAGIRPFVGAPRATPKHAHEAPRAMLVGPVALAGAGILAGLFAHPFGEVFVGPAASSIVGDVGGKPARIHPHLALWHGFKPAAMFLLGLSAVTLAGAAALYFNWTTARRLHRATLRRYEKIGPARAFKASLVGLKTLAAWTTGRMQGGHLRRYNAWVLLTTIALTSLAYFRSGEPIFAMPAAVGWRLHEVAMVAAMVAAVYIAVRTDSRLGAVAALGVVGYGMTLLFVYFGAPDLAMTQFSVETLTVVIFVLVLYKLPKFAKYTSPLQRRKSAIFAATIGGLTSLFALIVGAARGKSELTLYFAERSLTEAKGRNVVNVILVDFRGIDTLGEITVLSIAALGIWSLLRSRSLPGPGEAPGSAGGAEAGR